MQYCMSEFAFGDLIKVMEAIKKILKLRVVTYADETDTNPTENVLSILEDQIACNIEGTDPAQERIFESCHPLPPGKPYQMRENYQV